MAKRMTTDDSIKSVLIFNISKDISDSLEKKGIIDARRIINAQGMKQATVSELAMEKLQHKLIL